MSSTEWLEIYAYLSLGTGKALANREAVGIYFDLLKDLPAEAVKTAAQRVLMEHPWATFPSIAELRAAAVATVQHLVTELSPGEAWNVAWSAIKRIDPDQEGSVERGCKHVHPLVLEAMSTMGIAAMCFGGDPVGVLRGQFMKIFEQLSARERRMALFPRQIKEAITNGERKQITEIAKKIGTPPTC
jgi:hypothetical protein